MKKIWIYIVVFCGLMIGANSCYEDKGNYDYVSLPEIGLEGLKDEYTVVQLDTLKLEPVIRLNGLNESDFEYSWRLWVVNDGEKMLISENKSLVYRVTDAPATYALVLTAHNKRTNVDTYRRIRLTVQGTFGEGWMVLHEKDGKTDFDFLMTPYFVPELTAEKIYRGVYEQANGATLREHGVQISSTYYNNSKQNIYLLTENGGVRLSYVSMKKDFDIPFMLLGAGAVKPQRYSWLYSCLLNSGGNALISDGKLYFCSVGQTEFALPGIKDDKLTYYASPYIVRWQGAVRYYFYDDLHGRFLRIVGNVYCVEEVPTLPGAIFDLAHMNGRMVYMEPGFNNYQYAVIQDFQTNKRTLYVADFTKNTDDKPVAIYAMTNCPEIDNAKCFTIGNRGHVFYYAVGNQVYLYDYYGKNSAEGCLQTLDKMPVVSMKILKSNDGKAITKHPYDNKVLVIATYDEVQKTGKVYMYRINESNGAIDKESVKVFDGFGKIVDMDYKFPRYGV